MNHRVVVTGLGVVTPLGYDWNTFWTALVSGQSAIRPWTLPTEHSFPVKYAAPVDRADFRARFDYILQGLEPMELRSEFGLVAAIQAVLDAGLDVQRDRVGVIVGTGVAERNVCDMLLTLGDGGPTWERLYRLRRQLDPSCRQNLDHLAVLIARHLGCGGPVLNLNTACAGGGQAVGTAFRMIRRGEVECMIAGASDSVLSLLTLASLHLLGIPSVATQHGPNLCRPFDRDRSGVVAGEGAGIVVLENEKRAQARGARIYAEVCGYGSSLDAYNLTAPRPDGAGVALAMQKALTDADLNTFEVDHINAHATSTRLNDSAETKAIKEVFKDREHYRKIVITANKSQLGHLIAASGAPEFIATVLSLKFGQVPPTLNLDNPDAECDLDYVPHVARDVSIRAALSNSSGFGGFNASLAVRRYEP